MEELAVSPDSKSGASDGVWVRVPPSLPNTRKNMVEVILLFAALLIKHFIADFPLQIYYAILGKIQNKQKLTHDLVIHSFAHGSLTAIIFIAFGLLADKEIALAMGFLFGIIDGAVHGAIDSVVLRIGKDTNYTLNDNAFKQIFGLDQLLHGLTSVALIYWYYVW